MSKLHDLRFPIKYRPEDEALYGILQFEREQDRGY